MAEPNWKNRTIWTGDNLDIMRGMNSESIDLIYLDPPFNSNHNYAASIGSEAAGATFKDTWTLNDIDKEWHGIIADTEPKLYTVIHMTGEVHSKSMKSYLIYMSIRLLEMKRILKPAGNIYLHCDTTASHYLKLAMDSIFDKSNFRNEIIWKRRTDKHNLAKKSMGKIHDVILFYAKSKDGLYNIQYLPYDESYLQSHYKHQDKKGFYRTLPCTNEAGGNNPYDFKGMIRAWRFKPATMLAMYDDGLLVQTSKDSPWQYKKYLSEAKGVPIQDLWDDISPARGKESTGYPTQKPLTLLNRIIQASSHKGDVVFDPFCGCATTCVAADIQQRQWVGIDISSKATELVKIRIKKEGGLFGDIIARDDIPKRTDSDNLKKYNSKDNKLFLYGKQDGLCVGCETYFPYRNMSIDHIMPQSKGGGDNIENLQILCGACNSQKGSKTQAEWLAYRKTLGL